MKIGADVECFIIDHQNHKIVAPEFYPEFAGRIDVPGYGYIEPDGTALELHPNPHEGYENRTSSDLIILYNHAMTIARTIDDNLGIGPINYVYEGWQPPWSTVPYSLQKSVQKTTPKPFYCAYDHEWYEGKKDDDIPSRSGGFHIHIGASNSTKPELLHYNAKTICRFLDIWLTIPLLPYADQNEYKRRLTYGQAGTFRLPSHGVEYRTLSSACWSRKEAIFKKVLIANSLFLHNMGDIEIFLHNTYHQFPAQNIRHLIDYGYCLSNKINTPLAVATLIQDTNDFVSRFISLR